MSSDWSTVNAQSTSTTTSHHSTPTKPRLVSNRFAHQCVDEGLKEELDRYRYSGISFEDFLKSVFAVSKTEVELEDLKKTVTEASVHTSTAYQQELFSEKELLHWDISIFNMAYYEKDNEKFATLIDFDLATFPDDTQSPTEVTAEPAAPQENLQGAVAVPNTVQPVLQERSGTTPFMAIETLDSDSLGYKHHLCHELESIFYVIIWHALGYRHKKDIYPTKDNRNNTDRRKIDILKGWRAGSWSAVANMKVAFINRPDEVLNLITYPILVEIGIALLRVISSRQQTVASKRLERRSLIARAKIQQELQSGTLAVVQLHVPMPVVPRPKIDIFPEFASAWGITGTECQKSCCVDRSTVAVPNYF